jgi:NAD-dependent deacetylase
MRGVTPPPLDSIRRAAALFSDATSVLFITGAGLGADSGLPTYRGVGGLYQDSRTEDGVPVEVALSGGMMKTRPELTWKYIAEIERACRTARPNRGHEVIAAFGRRVPRTVVLTQNVDGFHLEAGSREVIEIHGNLRKLRCTECSHRRVVRDYSQLDIPPRCPACGGVVRPDVVLFGESLPEPAVRRLRDELVHGFDLLVTVGTKASFPYVSSPIVEARRTGGKTIEIDPGETEVTPFVDLKLASKAAETLGAIARELRLR